MKLPHMDSVKKTLEVSDMSFFFFIIIIIFFVNKRGTYNVDRFWDRNNFFPFGWITDYIPPFICTSRD